MQQGGAGAVVFKGQSKGWGETVLTLSWPGQPVCQTPFSSIQTWQFNVLHFCREAKYFYEIYISGHLSVRCGILSTSYFRSRTGWVYHQIRIAKICSSWIPRIFWPLLTFQPFCPGDKDWNFFHFMIILTTVTRTMFQDPIVVIKKNLNKIRSQKWMAFIITSIWNVQHPRLGPTFSYGEWSLSFHGDEHLKAHW